MWPEEMRRLGHEPGGRSPLTSPFAVGMTVRMSVPVPLAMPVTVLMRPGLLICHDASMAQMTRLA
jgi:hypothetical protein